MIEINKKLAGRLNQLMIDYDLKYTDIEENTGYSRQTITKYLTGKQLIKFDFICKYYKYLNSLNNLQNLNFMYMIDTECELKYITPIEQLKNLGLSQSALNNIDNICTNTKKEPVNELQELIGVDKIDYSKLYMLNALLENPNLADLLQALVNIYESADINNQDFLMWKLEKTLNNYADMLLPSILEVKKLNKPTNE